MKFIGCYDKNKERLLNKFKKFGMALPSECLEKHALQIENTDFHSVKKPYIGSLTVRDIIEETLVLLDRHCSVINCQNYWQIIFL